MAKNINRAKSNLAKNAVPNIVNLTRTNAKTLLESLGFKYIETSQATSTIGNDDTLVRGQDIPTGTVDPLNTTVTATVYSFGFTPFGFTPFAAFGFTPFTAFGFTPFTAFGFTPFSAFGFTPGSKFCVDQDTPILVVGENDSVISKPAKDIRVGDKVWSGTFDEYIDESADGYKGYLYSKTMTNVRKVQSEVMAIIPSIRKETIYFNDDTSKRFSLTERIVINRKGIYQYVPSNDVLIGDYFIQYNEDGSITEAEITNRTIVEQEQRDVYRFSVEPVDHIFAGNMLVHNYK